MDAVHLATVIPCLALLAAIAVVSSPAAADEADAEDAGAASLGSQLAQDAEPITADDDEDPADDGARWVVLPVVGYASETSVQLGAIVSVNWRGDVAAELREGDAQSMVSLSGTRTLNNQLRVRTGADLRADGGRWRVAADAMYERFPDRFFGVGAHPGSSYEEDYELTSSLVTLDVVHRFGRSFYAGPRYRLLATAVTQKTDTGLFAQDLVPGGDRDLASGAGLSIAWDTRDRTRDTRSGVYALTSAVAHGAWLGGRRTFVQQVVDLRGYVPLSHRMVFAGQAVGQFTPGDPGFSSMATVGGSSLMRGIYRGHFIDRHAWALQGELRHPIAWRFRGAVFAGLADVAPRIEDFDVGTLLWSVGGGLRFLLPRTDDAYIRVDAGYGSGDFGVYFNVNEAF